MHFRAAALVLVLSCWHSPSWAQCAPAPDSPYFFRNLAEQRAEAKLAENRGFYDDLLSDTFSSKDSHGKPLPKQDFIKKEFAANHANTRNGFFAVRDFRLVEHRQGYVVASYRLVEGSTGKSAKRATATWQREVYEVQDGRWRLVSVDNARPSPARAAQPKASGAN